MYYIHCVKTESGRLNFFLFLFLIFYSFDFLFYFLFLELGLEMRSQGHKSHDLWKDIKDSGRMRLYHICHTYKP